MASANVKVMNQVVRTIIFEDNKVLRQALKICLEAEKSIYLIDAYKDANDAVKIVRKYEPDVVVMDIQMPGTSGLDALGQIMAAMPKTKVLIHTQYEDDHRIFIGLCRGAEGYLVKSTNPNDLVGAIHAVHKGQGFISPIIASKVMRLFNEKIVKEQPTYVSLTDREHETLSLLCQGKTYEMIADAMSIGFHGVQSHIKNIYKKLKVNSAPEAIIKAIELRLIIK